ncbi:MAG: type III secretion system chaperone [Betaproteobacteria bacterium]|nr:type III secretion system chaperone [Betaproteobacteria bacterium]
MRDAHLLLERLSAAMGGVPIEVDDHGSAGVLLSDGSTIGLQIDSQVNELWLYADLGALPDQPELPEELLQMQLFGRHTGGGAIAIGPGLDGSEHLVL